MITETNQTPMAAMEPGAIASVPLNPTRPFYWSVRRELWENRSLVIAPLAAGAAIVLGFIASMLDLSGPKAADWLRGGAQATVGTPYDIAAMVMILAGLLTGCFYSIDALHGEHRDRSILFWKSLPVSDRTAVLSKASIPLLVLPLVIFVATVATQLVMILLGTAALAIRGDGDGPRATGGCSSSRRSSSTG